MNNKEITKVLQSNKPDYFAYNGDGLELLKNIPDNSIDCILIDPPYNLAFNNKVKAKTNKSVNNIVNIRVSKKKKNFTNNENLFNNDVNSEIDKTRKNKYRSNINTEIASWDKNQEFYLDKYMDDYLRILKKDGNFLTFCSDDQFCEWKPMLNKLFDSCIWLAYKKSNPVPKIRKTTFLSSAELMIYAYNKSHFINFLGQNQMHKIIDYPICQGIERLKNNDGLNLHPTQKPLKLISHLLERICKKNGVVLDTFAGTFTTGVACSKLNMSFIGSEIDKTYFDAGVKRLENEYKQIKLF